MWLTGSNWLWWHSAGCGHYVCDDNKLMKHCASDCMYNAFIVPVLTYNMGTWALTRTESARLDSFQHGQLKQLLRIRWPQKNSNKTLYKRCQCEPLSIKMIEARWRLFGHKLRMPKNVPAQMAIDQYFQPTTDVPSWRG